MMTRNGEKPFQRRQVKKAFKEVCKDVPFSKPKDSFMKRSKATHHLSNMVEAVIWHKHVWLPVEPSPWDLLMT